MGRDRKPMTLIVLVDALPLADAIAAVPADAASFDLLAFGGARSIAEPFAARAGPRLQDTWRLVDLMRTVVPVVRRRLVAFVAEWSKTPVASGRTFADAFTARGRSAWWFTELLHKNPTTRPTMSRLCELEALRRVLSQRRYGRVILIGRDRDQAGVLMQACARANVAVSLSPRPTEDGGPGFAALLMGRAKRWLLDVAATMLARRHALPQSLPPSSSSRRAIAFFTWFPAQWRSWRGVVRDRYFVDLPDLIRDRTPWTPFYVCQLPAPSLKALRANVAQAADHVRREPGTCIFLERWSRVAAVCRIYADLREPLAYWRLERFDARFRQSFRWDDIDVFPIVRHDLRVSMMRDVAYYDLLAHRLRRMIAQARPSDLVTIIETYPHGRAVASAVRAAGAGTRVIGLQHSPINDNQLMYRFAPWETALLPMPDYFLLFGEDARRIVRESGIGDDRLAVTGARRFDDLAEFRSRRRDDFAALHGRWTDDPQTRVILVATNYWRDMSAALLEMCVRALADRDHTIVVVKPHPNHRTAREELRPPADARARFIVTDDNINELQAGADVMVGGFGGTADAEALAIGCPVIRVALADLDLSPTADFPGSVPEVSTADELRAAVDSVVGAGGAPTLPPRFVERVFHRLDGRSGERTIEALEAIDQGAAMPAQARSG